VRSASLEVPRTRSIFVASIIAPTVLNLQFGGVEMIRKILLPLGAKLKELGGDPKRPFGRDCDLCRARRRDRVPIDSRGMVGPGLGLAWRLGLVRWLGMASRRCYRSFPGSRGRSDISGAGLSLGAAALYAVWILRSWALGLLIGSQLAVR